jgi:glycosyltransferase involved in cell wall biosynthesis
VPLCGWKAQGGWLKSPLRLARWYERLRPVVDAAVARERPEAIHAHDLDVAGPAQEAALELSVPFVYDVAGAPYVDRLHALVAPESTGARRRAHEAAIAVLRRRGAALETRLRRRGLTAAVADTDCLAEEMARRYGGGRPHVVRCCPPFRAPRRTGALRVKVGAHPTDRLVLFVGPVTEGCGIDAAILALKLLGDGHLLVILGHVPRLTRFERLAQVEGVAAQVRFVAPAPEPEMAHLAASADVAIVPTEPSTAVNRIGVPASLYLALAAGLPVVASDTREVGALVRRTGAGVLYPARSPQDPAALAEGVRTVLDDRSLAAACAEAAVRAAREELNWERQSVRLVDLYDAIEGGR